MSIMDFLSSGLEFAGTFSPLLMLILFLICFIGEAFTIVVPYAFETMWLMVGYQLSKGMISPLDLVFLLLSAQVGRQLGALVFGALAKIGITPILKYLQKSRWIASMNSSTHSKLMKRINLLSPFSVALGRLLWLRIPLTLVLSAQNKFGILAAAVLISGIVWDCCYIALGSIVGVTLKLDPVYVFVFFLIGLTVLYIVVFFARRIYNSAVNGRSSGTTTPM